MTFYGTGRFKNYGNVGAFVHNHSYAVQIKTKLFGRIEIVAVHGYEAKPLEGCSAEYDNLPSFLLDWDVSNVRTQYIPEQNA